MSRCIELRGMSDDDLGAVSRLGVRSKASWGYSAAEMEVFAGELTITENDLAGFLDAQVAVVDDAIVGYFTLCQQPSACSELQHLFVDPAWFEQGVGTLLLHHAIESARRAKITELVIVSDPNAVDFYLKHGAGLRGQHQSSIPGRSIPVLFMKTSRADVGNVSD